jgi:hypothetical protein
VDVVNRNSESTRKLTMRITTMKITKRSAAALGVTAAIAFAAVPAFAQDATQSPTEQTAPAEGAAPDEAARDARMAERQTAFAEALAAELDLPVDQVTDAVTKVGEQLRAEHDSERQAALQDRLDEAVTNGDLTQEQADAMAAAAEAGVLGGRDGHGGHHGRSGMGGFGPPAGGAPDAPTDTAS